MASFGYSVGDAVALGQIAWNVVRNARAACGEHDELTREVSSLHVVLKRLEQEGSNTESLINKPDNAQELHGIVKGCEKVLKILDDILQKYNSLGEDEKRAKKLWKKIRFGNGEMQDLGQLRAKVSYYTSAISLFLNMLTVGSLGRVEQQMNSAGDELRAIRFAVNGITAHLLSGHREGSVLTAYDDDDKAVWRAFRRELVLDGFSSAIIHKHKKLIKAYVKELGDRGLLDDPAEVDGGNVLTSNTANDHQEEFPQEVQGQIMLSDGETGFKMKVGIAQNQENGKVAEENSPSSEIAQERVPKSTTDDDHREDPAREQQEQVRISDEEFEFRKGAGPVADQEDRKTAAEKSPPRDVTNENIPSCPPHASVESDIDEDDMPGSHSFCEDPAIILEPDVLEDIGAIGNTVEGTASHILSLDLEHHTTSKDTPLFEPFVQRATEAAIRRRLTSYIAYDIGEVDHICSRNYWWPRDSLDITPLNASTRIFDLNSCKFFPQGASPVFSTTSQTIKDWNWERAYITRLDFTMEQLKLETTHGNRRPLAEVEKELSLNQLRQIEHLVKDLNSNEQNPIFEWQLAQIRLRYDMYSVITDFIVTVRRTPEKSNSFETLYHEYAQQFPDGLLDQIQPASDIKSAPQPHSTLTLKDGDGFSGTYYKGLALTTNLRAVDRTLGGRELRGWKLALIHIDDASLGKKAQSVLAARKARKIR